MRVLVLMLVALTGCASPFQRREHADACGPAALARTYQPGGAPDVHQACARRVSGEILDTSPGGTAARAVLSVLDPRAVDITWPGELLASIRRHGLRHVPVGGGDRGLWAWANTGQRGVLLVRNPGDPFDWHYLALPMTPRERARFGAWTAVDGWMVTLEVLVGE